MKPSLAPTTTAEAIGMTKPFRSPGQETVIAVLLCAEALRNRFQDLCTEHGGVTLQQFNVLRILRGAGAGGLPTLTIAERMIERTPGITRLVDRLVDAGLVERERRSDDRRQVFCKITKAGLAVLQKLDRPIDALDAAASGPLTRAETRTLVDLLDRVRNAQRG